MLKRFKLLFRWILPPTIRLALRHPWENLREWSEALALGLHFAVTRTIRPKILMYFGYAPGDDLLSTAVMRELRTRGRDGLMMISGHRELFEGNKDPTYVRPMWSRYSPYRSTVAICRRFVRIWGGEFIRLEYAPMDGKDRRRPPSRHVIAEMCTRAGISGPVSIRPYLNLNEKERSLAAWASGHIAIQSSGAAARQPALLKEWYPERFQAAVDALRNEFEFIQLGSTRDPPLQNVKDLRGATTMRESAAILYNARLFVGLEGFIMHMARAVECPSVIVFGGRAAPWQLGYTCNFNLYSEVPCAPCWRQHTCDFDRRCMSNISVEDVVSAIRQMLLRPRSPLAVETIDLPTSEPATSFSA